ncbi:hypothetical protein MTR67_049716 [Solanum verrucosum]|uniref:Uncharacterized protein n=1 Tax=Solanum verrucosum TaxID=315347 RepID=A0AAF0V3U9_SOLVR|nr:hypothetical protein MTR67_049716 [Solanum verrucosum]
MRFPSDYFHYCRDAYIVVVVVVVVVADSITCSKYDVVLSNAFVAIYCPENSILRSTVICPQSVGEERYFFFSLEFHFSFISMRRKY